MSINHRIFILVVATIIVVAWPLLYISEEMYQDQITKIVDNTARETIQQTLLFMKESPESGRFLNSVPAPGKQTFIFDAEGRIIEGDNSAEVVALVDSLRRQLLAQWRDSSIVTAAVTTKGNNPKGWDCAVGFSRGIGAYVAVCYDRDYTYDASASMQLTAGMLALAVLVMGLLGAKLVSARMTRPLRRLTTYARQLPTKDFAADDRENILSALEAVKDKDIGELVRAFAYMEKELARYIQNEREAAAERERIRSELRIAAEIQQGALPERLQVPGDMASIKAHMVPALEVGGDLYDYFMVDEHTLMFSLGDVSGKGVPAALFMFATQHMLRSLAMRKLSLEEVMAKLNNTLSENNASAMFVTMVVGRYDLRTGELEYALAGHQPPLLRKADGTIEDLKGPANLPVGNVGGFEFESRTIKLDKEDSVVVFTDGVTEACDSENNLFGMERLTSLLQNNDSLHCEGLLETVFGSVAEFSEGCEMQDDVTVLCFRHRG